MRNLMIAAGTALSLATVAQAGTPVYSVTLNISGVQSWDSFGDVDNEVYAIDLASAAGLPAGTPVSVTGAAYNVRLATVGLSWRSEARMYFDDNIAPDGSGLILTPGFADGSPGTSTYNSGGIIDLSDNGIPNIGLPNGVLRLEFYESYDDVNGAVDANWTDVSQGVPSTVTVYFTPTPGAAAVLGLAGIAGLRRRR